MKFLRHLTIIFFRKKLYFVCLFIFYIYLPNQINYNDKKLQYLLLLLPYKLGREGIVVTIIEIKSLSNWKGFFYAN